MCNCSIFGKVLGFLWWLLLKRQHSHVFITKQSHYFVETLCAYARKNPTTVFKNQNLWMTVAQITVESWNCNDQVPGGQVWAEGARQGCLCLTIHRQSPSAPEFAEDAPPIYPVLGITLEILSMLEVLNGKESWIYSWENRLIKVKRSTQGSETLHGGILPSVSLPFLNLLRLFE